MGSRLGNPGMFLLRALYSYHHDRLRALPATRALAILLSGNGQLPIGQQTESLESPTPK